MSLLTGPVLQKRPSAMDSNREGQLSEVMSLLKNFSTRGQLEHGRLPNGTKFNKVDVTLRVTLAVKRSLSAFVTRRVTATIVAI